MVKSGHGDNGLARDTATTGFTKACRARERDMGDGEERVLSSGHARRLKFGTAVEGGAGRK
jgi:hypothetical protein